MPARSDLNDGRGREGRGGLRRRVDGDEEEEAHIDRRLPRALIYREIKRGKRKEKEGKRLGP